MYNFNRPAILHMDLDFVFCKHCHADEWIGVCRMKFNPSLRPFPQNLTSIYVEEHLAPVGQYSTLSTN